jgi:hypothetical protein
MNDNFIDDDYDGLLTIRNCIFGFKCDKKWSELTITSDDEIKFCQTCQKEVYFCKSDDALASYVRLNRCVAIHREGIINEVTMGYVIGPRDSD